MGSGPTTDLAGVFSGNALPLEQEEGEVKGRDHEPRRVHFSWKSPVRPEDLQDLGAPAEMGAWLQFSALCIPWERWRSQI